MENAEHDQKIAKLEALLFIHGEPLTVKKIATLLQLEDEQVRTLVADLKERLNGPDRGLALLTDQDKIQLVTKSQFHDIVKDFIKESLSEELTPASLETLALISYFGPIARTQLEYLRGVNSTFTLRNLQVRGLIERIPDPARVNSYLYQPSFDLLRHLGVENQEGLPEFGQFKQRFEQSQQQAAAEPPAAS